MAESPMARDVLPPAEEKAAAVRRMFHAIAPRYDLLNHLLSFNRDKRWRRKAIDALLRGAAAAPGAGTGEGSGEIVHGNGHGHVPGADPLAGRYLDVCAGTLDLGLELAKRKGFRGFVVGSDFTYEMLRRGRHKIGAARLAPACADALRLPFPDGSFDGTFVGFGIRNVADLDGGLREMRRILRPGGRAVILEFTVPEWQPFRALYLLYFRRILPAVGRLVSKHGTAYSYLPASVLEFPRREALAERMRQAGFGDVRWETYAGGIVAAHVGTAV